MTDGTRPNTVQLDHAEINTPVVPNSRLYAARDAHGELTYKYISVGQISEDGKNRISHPSVIKQGKKIFCYKSVTGEWIPELRLSKAKSDEQEKYDMYFRIEQDLENAANQVAGVLARGDDGLDLIQRFRPQVRGRSGFSTLVTRHQNPSDTFGRADLGIDEVSSGPNPVTYTRVAILNALNDGKIAHEIILETLMPGTREDDPDFKIDPSALNRQEIDFEGIASDNQTIAFYDPAQKKWTAQTVPFGMLGTHPYDARNHYINGFFTGIIAYEIDGGVYIFRLDEHIKRALRDAKKTQFPNVDEAMLYEMTKAQLSADKRWIPNAHKNIDNPETGEKGIGNRHYFRIFASPTHLGPKISKPGKARNKMISAIGTAAGPYKDKDMLNVILRGSRPVNPAFAANKYSGNYQAAMDNLHPYLINGYDEGMFTAGTDQTIEGRRLQEGSGCNYIIVKYGKEGQSPTMLIPNPQNHSDILPGITCKSVAELAESYGFNVEWKDVSVSDLDGADEVLATGTAMSVRGVGKIDWNTGEKDQEGKAIMKALFDRNSQQSMGEVGQRLSEDMKRIMRREHPDARFNDWMQKIA